MLRTQKDRAGPDMPDFDTRTRQEPDEPPSRPRSPSMAGRVGNLLIAILRWAPIASYALAHVIVVGFWAFIVSVYGVDPNPYYGVDPKTDLDSRLLNPDLATSLLRFFPVTAILMVPVGAVLGAVDAAARRSSHPLLLVVDALLIVLFALVWIYPVLIRLGYNICDDYTCVSITPNWPMYIGGFIGVELGLVALMVVSVWRRRRK